VRAFLTIAGVTVATADLWLGVISWKRRSVLTGALGAIGIPVVAFSVLEDPTHAAHEEALAIATIMLIVGIVLYGIGEAIQRLLDTEPDEHAPR
jgi:uncharacterized membrane protein YczE